MDGKIKGGGGHGPCWSTLSSTMASTQLDDIKVYAMVFKASALGRLGALAAPWKSARFRRLVCLSAQVPA